MYFYKKILYVALGFALLSFITILVFMTGMSNFEASVGAPTILEIKLIENLNKRNRYESISISDITVDNNKREIYKVVEGNFSSLTPPPPPPKLDVKGEAEPEVLLQLKERRDRIKSLCEQYHLGNYSWPNGTNDLGIKDPITPLYSYFFHDREHKLAWCPVYKSGSTTWLYNMMILKGYSEDFLAHPPKQLSVLADEIYQDAEPGKDFDEAAKLLVVRHPFERLISAYRDKLSNSSIGMEHGTSHFYEKYGKMIVKKFRNNTKILQREPTFEEFVRYLIKTDLVYYADDHWLPAYLSCTPCRVSYDYVAKVETYMNDQKLIIEQMHLNNVIKPRWQHRTDLLKGIQEEKKMPSSSHSNAEKYFSQLTKSQVRSLYKKYFLDFQLFGYSYSEYLDFAMSD